MGKTRGMAFVCMTKYFYQEGKVSFESVKFFNIALEYLATLFHFPTGLLLSILSVFHLYWVPVHIP